LLHAAGAFAQAPLRRLRQAAGAAKSHAAWAPKSMAEKLLACLEMTTKRRIGWIANTPIIAPKQAQVGPRNGVIDCRY